MMPGLLRTTDAWAVGRLFSEFRASRGRSDPEARLAYAAELMALMSVEGASDPERGRWLSDLAGIGKPRLARAFGRIGLLGFSFPIWRFPAQRLSAPDGRKLPSLLERFGMRRLDRPTDAEIGRDGIRHDRLGTGYLSADGCVEYRRAYLRISVPESGHLLIRNSSWFWGRDRFLRPAYFSPHDLPAERLLDLTSSDVDDGGLLRPLTDAADWHDAAGKLTRSCDALWKFESALARWLFDGRSLYGSPGFPHLLEHLAARLDAAPGTPPILGFIDPESPPWFPFAALQVDQEVLDELSRRSQAGPLGEFLRLGVSKRAKLALLSGKDGDLPF
jgi:hypothetical protein